MTGHEDDGGNYPSQGGVHTGPFITPQLRPGVIEGPNEHHRGK